MKATVAEVIEFVKWSEEHKVWDKLYIDDDVVEGGVGPSDTFDLEYLARMDPSDKVSVDGALLFHDYSEGSCALSFDGVSIKVDAYDGAPLSSLYRKWKQKQLTTTLAVQIPNHMVGEFKTYVMAIGGKVA